MSTAATYGYYWSQPKKYAAATQMYLNASQISTLLTGVPSPPSSDRSAENLAELARTRAVASAAAQKLKDGRSADQILAAASVKATAGTDFLTVASTDRDPGRAAATANAFAAAFEETRTQEFRAQARQAADQGRRQLQALGTLPTPQREAVKQRLAQLDAFLATPSADVSQLDPALVPQVAIGPRPLRNSVFAAAISLVLAIFAAYGLARFDLRVRHLGDIEDAYSLPLLAAVPHLRPSKSADPTIVDPAAQEPLRSLQSALRLASLDGPVKTILVTSAVPGEGKSTLVRNLALVQRDEGVSVVVLEADLRRPVLRSWFKLPRGQGVTDVLAGQSSLTEALQSVVSKQAEPREVPAEQRGTIDTLARTGQLSILTSGPTPPNPSIVLADDQTAVMIKELAEQFNYVLIDAPPLLPVSDALPLLKLVDGVIIVSRLGITHRAAAKRLMALLDRVPDAKILGVVANDVVGDELYGTYNYSYAAPNGRRANV